MGVRGAGIEPALEAHSDSPIRVRGTVGSFCPTIRLAPRASLGAVRGYFSVWLGAQPRDRKVRPRKRQEQDDDPGFRPQKGPKKTASPQRRSAKRILWR